MDTATSLATYWYFHLPNFILAALMYTLLGRVLLGLGLCVASVVDVPLRGGTGDRTFAPSSVLDVRSPYRLAVGHLTLDLSDVDVSGTSPTVVADFLIAE